MTNFNTKYHPVENNLCSRPSVRPYPTNGVTTEQQRLRIIWYFTIS